MFFSSWALEKHRNSAPNNIKKANAENTQQNVTIIWMNDFCFNPKTKIIEMLSQPSTLKYLRLSLIFEYLHILPQHRMATTRKLRIIANILIIKLRQHFNRRQSRILKQKSPQKLAYIYHHIFSSFAHNRITVFKSKIHYGGRDNGK